MLCVSCMCIRMICTNYKKSKSKYIHCGRSTAALTLDLRDEWPSASALLSLPPPHSVALLCCPTCTNQPTHYLSTMLLSTLHSTVCTIYYALCTIQYAVWTPYTPMYHIQLCTTLCTMPPDTMQYAVCSKPKPICPLCHYPTMHYAICSMHYKNS